MIEKNNEKIYLDKEGYNEFLKSIDRIKEELQDVTKEKIEACRQDPSNLWHDNFMFEDSARRETVLLKHLQEKMQKTSLIEVIENHKDNNKVGINTNFSLQFENQEIENYYLVARQTDFTKNEVSINGPLGRAVFGKKVDEKICYKVENQIFSAIIKKIEI